MVKYGRDELGFEVLWELDDPGIMYLHEKLAYVRFPELETATVDNICEASLGIIGNSLPESLRIISSTPKLTLSSEERNESSSLI